MQNGEASADPAHPQGIRDPGGSAAAAARHLQPISKFVYGIKKKIQIH